MPSGVMPTRLSVLKEVLYKRNLPENRTVRQMDLVSCGFYNFESKCYQDGGCSEKSADQKCSVSKIKHRYGEAGIVTIPDRNIAKKIIELYDLYLAIKKKSLTTKGATDQRASFKASLMSLLLMLKIRLLTFTTKKRRRSFLPSRPKDQQEVRYELQ